VKVLPVLRMISNCAITRHEAHVADLALAGVEKNAVLLPSVTVAVLYSAVSGEEENEREFRRRAYPTCLLPLESSVEIPTPIYLALNEH